MRNLSCGVQSLQNDRIESLELLLQHLPKVRPSWWQMPDKSKIKVGHRILHTCRLRHTGEGNRAVMVRQPG